MILVCSEAPIDRFVGKPADAELPAPALAGESQFNVAMGLVRLGTAAAFLRGTSCDQFGDLLTDSMVRERIGTHFLKRSSRPTPFAVISTDVAGQPSYSFHSGGCAERDLQISDLPSLDPSIVAVALGSSLRA